MLIGDGLDIEFLESSKTFKFTAHYTQEPVFPELFKRLSGSPAIKSIEDEVFGKGKFRIHKQDWKKPEELKTEIGATNVIYYLVNSKDKEIYIGEAANLIKRLRTHFADNAKWEFYRYDKLPDSLDKSRRVALERMVIRSFASFLENKSKLTPLNISTFKLVNRKIDD